MHPATSLASPLPAAESLLNINLKEHAMNKDTVQGKAREMKGKLKQKWGQLTDDELTEIEGNAEILAGKLQVRYGVTREEAEQQVKDFRRENDWN